MPRQSTHCTGHSVYNVCPPAVKIRIQTDTKGRAETLVIVLLPSLRSFSVWSVFQRLFVENLSADSHQTPFCAAGAISYFVLFMSRLRAVRAHPRGHQDSVLTKIRLEKGLLAHKHASWRKVEKLLYSAASCCAGNLALGRSESGGFVLPQSSWLPPTPTAGGTHLEQAGG